MERLIITGGAGFIGCNFVRHVLDATEAQVLVLDKLTYAGSLESLRDVERHPRYRFVQGDIVDRDAVRALFAEFRPTAIANLAAESHVDRSIDGPGEFIRTNIQGTFELLEASRHYLAGLSEAERAGFRFLHVSTDEVYGSLGPTGLFEESTAYAPNSPYSASKAAADHLVRAYVHTYGLPAVITNCSNNYGPYQFPEKLIPLMVLNALDGRPLPIYGAGSNVRDWLHVEDHCLGLRLALERGVAGEKYNVGGHNERRNVEVVDAICAILEELYPAAGNEALRAAGVGSYSELKTYVRDRPGHDQRYAIDNAKIREELGWRPRYDFESGLRATVQWYLEHPEWCEAVTHGRYQRQRLGVAAAQA
jgi:dTDP-glucose 4,6-dehydratase